MSESEFLVALAVMWVACFVCYRIGVRAGFRRGAAVMRDYVDTRAGQLQYVDGALFRGARNIRTVGRVYRNCRFEGCTFDGVPVLEDCVVLP